MKRPRLQDDIISSCLFICKPRTQNTDRCLNDRIREHVPRWVERHLMSKIDNANRADRTPASSIARHLIESSHQVDLESAFSVVYRATKSRNLPIVEAVAISRLKPELWVQKNCLWFSDCHGVTDPWLWLLFPSLETIQHINVYLIICVLGLQMNRQDEVISSCNLGLFIALFNSLVLTQ